MRYKDLINSRKSTSKSDWILSDVKTGRWWSINSAREGDLKAHELGLKDYEIYQQEPDLKPIEPKLASLDMLLGKYKKD